MTEFLDIFGGLALVGGAVFLLLGGIGLNRMPDSFGRIQVGAKTTTLGTILVLIGAGLLLRAVGEFGAEDLLAPYLGLDKLYPVCYVHAGDGGVFKVCSCIRYDDKQ